MPFSARANDRLAVSLTFLWAINATQADTFRAVAVEDFEGVAVEDGDDGARGSHTLKQQGRPLHD
jgi:hypothetical protein